jgi:hypothetical protein
MNIIPNQSWLLISSDTVQPSFWILAPACQESTYIQGLRDLNERIKRGEPAVMSEQMRTQVEAALASSQESLSIRAWAKRMTLPFSKR